MPKALISDLKKRMQSTQDALHREFAGLRTGRASIALLEPVMVDAYGSKMALTSVGTISAPEARLLTVQVWDKSMVASVEKSIRESGLGLNPMADGQLIRIPLPELSQERRIEMTKIAKKYAENARVAIRNVRRDGMEALKKMEKEASLPEDEHHRYADEVQELTDTFIKHIDEDLALKEKDIMQV
ncbi:MAG: ribosome recycling factor [Alphaproteobacteria bacterium]|nr:ribosome recycling factor [Alphaproteobacteria bacterium]